jgi:hypothetical protein
VARSGGTDETRLRPCPFCGGKVTAFAKRGEVGTIHVDCRCGATGPGAKDEDQACRFRNGWIERWN